MRPFQLWELLHGARKLYASTTVGGVFATVAANFEVDSFIHNVSQQSLVDYLHLTYDLEGGANDSQGGIIGPFQFSEIAWRDVGMDNWRESAMDLTLSARAACKFYFLNKTRFDRRFPGKVYTQEIAYLYHNQGPSGAAYFLQRRSLKFGGQSRAANKLFAEIGPL